MNTHIHSLEAYVRHTHIHSLDTHVKHTHMHSLGTHSMTTSLVQAISLGLATLFYRVVPAHRDWHIETAGWNWAGFLD